MNHAEDWNGPISYPNHPHELDVSIEKPPTVEVEHAQIEDSLIEELKTKILDLSFPAGKWNKEQIGLAFDQAISKAEAVGFEHGRHIGIKDPAIKSLDVGYEMGKKEGRAEFAKELLEKMDKLLAKYSDDRRVPLAEIRFVIESELKGL